MKVTLAMFVFASKAHIHSANSHEMPHVIYSEVPFDTYQILAKASGVQTFERTDGAKITVNLDDCSAVHCGNIREEEKA